MGYSPWGHKESAMTEQVSTCAYTSGLPRWLRQRLQLHLLQEMQETCVQPLGHKDPLEKEMATHSSILAWKIPWTEKPTGLQSME